MSERKAKTQEGLEQLANDVIQDYVFMTNSEEGIRCAFMVPLMLLDEETTKFVADADPACFYAPMDEAGPGSVNGYPTFLSLSWLTQEEWKVFYPILEKKRAALGLSRGG